MIQNEKSEVRSRKSEKTGFTLIETVITLAVLAIAAVGALSVFSVGIRGSANPLLVAQSVQLAQEKMNTIIGDRENPAVGFGFAHIVPASYPAETPVTGFAGFSRATNIYCVTATDLNSNGGVPPCASRYTHVTVTVTNTTMGSMTAETVVTNY